MKEIELHKAGLAYLALLEIPLQSDWRALNQDIYARLRDHVAHLMLMTPERIQVEFEAKAHQVRTRDSDLEVKK